MPLAAAVAQARVHAVSWCRQLRICQQTGKVVEFFIAWFEYAGRAPRNFSNKEDAARAPQIPHWRKMPMSVALSVRNRTLLTSCRQPGSPNKASFSLKARCAPTGLSARVLRSVLHNRASPWHFPCTSGSPKCADCTATPAGGRHHPAQPVDGPTLFCLPFCAACDRRMNTFILASMC